MSNIMYNIYIHRIEYNIFQFSNYIGIYGFIKNIVNVFIYHTVYIHQSITKSVLYYIGTYSFDLLLYFSAISHYLQNYFYNTCFN